MSSSITKRLVQAFAAVIVAVSLAGMLGMVGAQTAHAATSTKGAASKISKPKSFCTFKSQGATVGSAKSTAKPLASIKIKGITGLKYSANSTTTFAKSGKATKAKKSGIEYITVKLPTTKAKTYDVWYRVYVKGYGWMGWAKNGAKAGNTGNKMYVTAFQVKAVKKSSSAKPNTDRAAYSAKGGFIKKITDNTSADALIKKWAKAGSMDLVKSLKKVRYNLNYRNLAFSFANTTSAFKSNLGTVVKTVVATKDASGYYYGDCYAHVTFGYYMAKYLGYKTSVVAGTYLSTSLKYEHNGNKPDGAIKMDKNGNPVLKKAQETSWLKVTLGGKSAIFDVTNMYRANGGTLTEAPERCAPITAKAPTFEYQDEPGVKHSLYGQFTAL